MTQATHLLVFLMVVSVYTSIHTLLLHLVISITQLDTKVLQRLTLVSSTAHMCHSRWFVQLVRIRSNQKSDSRLATAWSRTHSLQAMQTVLSVSVQLPQTIRLTNTTDWLKFLTSCNIIRLGSNQALE